MDKVLRKNAFTLLEILVTVMIVGVLTAVAVPRLGDVIEKFRAQEAIHLIQNIAAAQERYRIDNGQAYYTPGFDGLDIEIPGLRYFGAPVNAGTSAAWRVEVSRSDNRYKLFTTKNYGPQSIRCTEASGGPNAQAICSTLGLTYQGTMMMFDEPVEQSF